MPDTYCTQADLEDAMGVQIVLAVYDDDGDGVVDTRPMQSCLRYATTECNSYLRSEYPNMPITLASNVPEELKNAAIDFACAYTTRRRPDLMRSMNERSWRDFYDAAMNKVKNYRSGIQRMDASAAGTPANEGGQTTIGSGGITYSNTSGTISSNSGDF